MKAVICTAYGPPEVLELREVNKPIPKSNEVLIKIHATAVTASDCIVRGFKLPFWNPIGLMMGLVIGFKKPRNPILGMVLSGVIETTGKNVKYFKDEDSVFAWTVKSPIKIRLGTYAEYKCLPEDSVIALKPDNLSYEEAAAIPYGGLLAWSFLKKGDIQNRKKILIYGASGAIGTAAVQISKYFGVKVTGVCSTQNIGMVKSLGADKVIDYTKEDFTDKEEFYDLIFDAVGKKKSSKFKLNVKKSLTSGGKYISVDIGTPQPAVDDLIFLKELAEKEKLKPVIDSVYTLDEIVEAHRYVDKGHKKGNVVITVAEDLVNL